MSNPSNHYSTDHMKGTEVFVGGLPRTVSEDQLRKVFSSCGEIVEIRIMKDHQGTLKGFCFVRFSTKEAADRAVKEKSGLTLNGKKIGVLPSSEQDTLYFGNLNKAWSPDEFEKIVLQVFPDVASVDLPIIKATQSGQKQRNRGFAFVKFSSNAAAVRAQRVASQPEFRLGNLHPAVQWAEETENDQKEFAKIKIAFIRNLPVDVDENYLRQLFERFGKVEKVVISKKSSFPVGFVHFADRSDLDLAVKEMNERTIVGPNGGPAHKIQVEVARPMEKNKKRTREDSESNPAVPEDSRLFKEERIAAPDNLNPNAHKEFEYTDPYEMAVIALPLAVKERLLRILRLGIANRFDIDAKSLVSLKQLTESSAIAVLDQFLLSAAKLQNKGAYLTGLISRHLVDKVEPSSNFVSLPKILDNTTDESRLFSYASRVSPPPVGSLASHLQPEVARPDIYTSRYISPLSTYSLPNRALIESAEEKRPDYLSSSRSTLAIPEERSFSPYAISPESSIPYERIGLRHEERRFSPPVPPVHSSSYSRLQLGSSPGIIDRPMTRPQMRFDPFTGEPYKFDPFTGEPIEPRRF